jgi:thioredoxin 1
MMRSVPGTRDATRSDPAILETAMKREGRVGSDGYTATFQAIEPTADAVRALPGWTLLEFGTAWCGVCRGTQPALQAALGEHAGPLRHVKIADGKGHRLGRAFGVKLWPTLVLLRDGAEVGRSVRPAGAAAIASLLAPAR